MIARIGGGLCDGRPSHRPPICKGSIGRVFVMWASVELATGRLLAVSVDEACWCALEISHERGMIRDRIMRSVSDVR